MSSNLGPMIEEYRHLTKEYTRIGASRQRIKESFATYMKSYVEETGEDFIWVEGIRVKVHWEYNVHPGVLDKLHEVLTIPELNLLRKNNKWNVGCIQSAVHKGVITDPIALKIVERGLQHQVKSVSFMDWDEDLLGQAHRHRKIADKLERRVARRKARGEG